MLTGVASNMVGFVGKECKPLPSIYESMEVDQRPVYQEESMDMSSSDPPMPVSHKSVRNCLAMTHHSETSERLT